MMIIFEAFVNVALTLKNWQCVLDYKLLYSFGNLREQLYLCYICYELNIDLLKHFTYGKKCFYNIMHEKHNFQEDNIRWLSSVSYVTCHGFIAEKYTVRTN